MAKRVPRSGTQRGRPWQKGSTQRVWPESGTFEQRRDRELARLQASVDSGCDAAALVEAVRLYAKSGRPLPAWVPLALEKWLSDFLTLALTRRPGDWTRWARQWRPRFFDAMVAAHLVGSRETYGLTWAEAADEAADWFRGTPASGSPAKMLAAHKRDRKRGPQRPFTRFEDNVAGHLFSRPFRPDSWWAVNQDRIGTERGQWRSRPRLMSPARS
jgi:hypothetical protein